MPDIQILVISLAGSDARQKKVKSELDKTSFPWRFLDAIKGSALKTTPKEYKSAKVKKLLGFELTPNELGCFSCFVPPLLERNFLDGAGFEPLVFQELLLFWC